MPHIHEAIDFTVVGYLVNQDRVLMVNHKALKMWLPLGGHIELDQDPEEALFAEIEQESGVLPEELEFLSQKPAIISPGTKFLHSPDRLDIHMISTTHRHVGMVYYLRSLTDRIKLAEQEHTDIRWFKENELDDPQYNLTPAVKLYAQEALLSFKPTSMG
jgi:8-oxo-dGTP pyrophosphatase MutT (NUDIX family)